MGAVQKEALQKGIAPEAMEAAAKYIESMEAVQKEALEKGIVPELDTPQVGLGKSEAGGDAMPSDIGIPAKVEAKTNVAKVEPTVSTEAPKKKLLKNEKKL